MDDRYILLIQSGDPAVVPLVRTVLEAADIPFVVEGDEAGSLFPGGLSPFGPLARGMQVRVLVPASRVDEARSLLTADLSADLPDGGGAIDGDAADEDRD